MEGCRPGARGGEQWHEWQRRSGSGSRGSGRGRPIPMLPFPSEDVLVRGQSTTIVLREGRHHDLLDECVSGHGSLVGMALLDDDGLLEVMPLCEIGDVDVRAGYGLGVALHVTLRAVGGQPSRRLPG